MSQMMVKRFGYIMSQRDADDIQRWADDGGKPEPEPKVPPLVLDPGSGLHVGRQMGKTQSSAAMLEYLMRGKTLEVNRPVDPPWVKKPADEIVNVTRELNELKKGFLELSDQIKGVNEALTKMEKAGVTVDPNTVKDIKGQMKVIIDGVHVATLDGIRATESRNFTPLYEVGREGAIGYDVADGTFVPGGLTIGKGYLSTDPAQLFKDALESVEMQEPRTSIFRVTKNCTIEGADGFDLVLSPAVTIDIKGTPEAVKSYLGRSPKLQQALLDGSIVPMEKTEPTSEPPQKFSYKATKTCSVEGQSLFQDDVITYTSLGRLVVEDLVGSRPSLQEAIAKGWLVPVDLNEAATQKPVQDGEDVFIDRAAQVLGVDKSEVTTDQRRQMKTLLFAYHYGSGSIAQKLVKLKSEKEGLPWGEEVPLEIVPFESILSPKEEEPTDHLGATGLLGLIALSLFGGKKPDPKAPSDQVIPPVEEELDIEEPACQGEKNHGRT